MIVHYSTFALKKRSFVFIEVALLLAFLFFAFNFNILETVIDDVVYQKQMPEEIKTKMALYFSGFRKYFYLLLSAYLILKIVKALFGIQYDKSLPIKFEYQITPEALIYQQVGTIKTEVQWSAIQEIRFNRRSLDFISPHFQLTVPKSAFSDENHLKEFHQRALQYLSAKS